MGKQHNPELGRAKVGVQNVVVGKKTARFVLGGNCQPPNPRVAGAGGGGNLVPWQKWGGGGTKVPSEIKNQKKWGEILRFRAPVGGPLTFGLFWKKKDVHRCCGEKKKMCKTNLKPPLLTQMPVKKNRKKTNTRPQKKTGGTRGSKMWKRFFGELVGIPRQKKPVPLVENWGWTGGQFRFG